MSKHFKAIVIFAIFALSLVVLVFFVQYRATAKEKVVNAIPPAIVIVQPAKVQEWQREVQAVGTLTAIQGIMMQAAVSNGGIVTGIFFRSGQYVQAGQPLFQINPGIDRTLIRAPFSGQVGLKQVDLGDYIAPGTNLVNIEDTNPMKVQFFVPQTYVGDVSLGQTVTFTVNSYPNKIFTAKVFAIDAQLDPDTRGLAVWASVPNPDQELVPGTYANVTLYTSGQQQVITVPQTAIGYSYNGNFVYKVGPGGKAIKTTVTTGQRRGDDVEILSGLKAGDLIVAVGNGLQKFEDGSQLLPEGTPQYTQFSNAMDGLVSGKLTMKQLQQMKAEQQAKMQQAKKPAATGTATATAPNKSTPAS